MPLAAKIAFMSAGATGGTPGSPTPPMYGRTRVTVLPPGPSFAMESVPAIPVHAIANKRQMTNLITFDEALEETENCPRILLLGNGFSIKFFHYRNLLDNAQLAIDDPIRSLFQLLDTYDFERVIRSLEEASIVETAYRDSSKAELFTVDCEKIRQAPIHAIRSTHPKHRKDIEPYLNRCITFLKYFGDIFTLNYDLLMYWITLEDTRRFQDGFGLGGEENGLLGPFKVEAHCNVHYLHGGLHLFVADDGEIEKRLKSSQGLIEAITSTIAYERRLPLYVAEGTSIAKLRKINSNKYLTYCSAKLRRATVNCFVYGHSADPNDVHIYNAIFNSDVEHLYFCIHKPTADVPKVEGELSRYQKLFSSNIKYTLVDAESVGIWND